MTAIKMQLEFDEKADMGLFISTIDLFAESQDVNVKIGFEEKTFNKMLEKYIKRKQND